MLVQLLDTAPDRVEVRGNLMYYHFSDGTAVHAQPISAAMRTTVLVQEAFNRMRVDNDNVVPLCEICVRRDLPRIDKP